MSKIWAERFTALGMIVVAGYFLTQSIGLPSTAGAFPQFTEYMIMFLAVVMILRTFRTHDKKLQGTVTFDFSYANMKPLYVMVVTIAYVLAVFEIGFYVSSVVFFLLVTWMTGIRNWKVMGGTAIVLFPLMYVFFTIVLEANLPEGIAL